MTGEEALVECVFNGQMVMGAHWKDGQYLVMDGGGRVVNQNGDIVTLIDFVTMLDDWKIYKPKETCSFVELFDKLKPGDWATRSDCKGGNVSTRHFIGQGGILSFWCGSSEMPVMVDKALIKSTFIIHSAE